MSDFAKKFRRMPLLLQRIGIIGGSYDLDLVRNQLPFLSFTLRRDQRAAHNDRRSSCKALHSRVIGQRVFCDDLQISQAGAVVEFDERKILRITTGPNPALDLN